MSSFSSTRREPYTAVHACKVQQLFPGAFVGIHPQIVPDKVRNIFHFTRDRGEDIAKATHFSARTRDVLPGVEQGFGHGQDLLRARVCSSEGGRS